MHLAMISIVHSITGVIDSLGYGGIIILIALESAAIPIPSEIIFPFSGYLVYRGTFSLLGVTVAGAVGSLVGSLGMYLLARYLGRPAIETYGKRIPGFAHGLTMSEDFFTKHGFVWLFIGRMLPVVRTYISIPAGFARANILSFSIFCVAGSAIWGLFLAWIGYLLGDNWYIAGAYIEKFSYAIAAALVVALIYYWWRKARKN